MIPYIHIEPLRIGTLVVQPFGVLVALGVSVGYWLAVRRAKYLGLDSTQLESFICWILVAGFAGAHVLDSTFYHPDEVLARPWTLLFVWGGLSSFGGFFGAMLGAFAWKYFELRTSPKLRRRIHVPYPARRDRPLSILGYSDVILAVFPVAWIFGRAGCAVVHDHPGTRALAGSWLAVAYGPGPGDKFLLGLVELRHGVEPRYDLGLLELLVTIALAIVFALTWHRGRFSGWYVVAACVTYAPVRFALDFLRVDDAVYAGLTPAQWACGALLLFGLGIAHRIRANKNTTRNPACCDGYLGT